MDYGYLRRLFLELAGPICDNAREEREVLLDYLGASGLVGGRRVGLIDVGWHGTMQRSITDMLRERATGRRSRASISAHMGSRTRSFCPTRNILTTPTCSGGAIRTTTGA